MTAKNYRLIKLTFVVAVAIIVSQSIIFKNYLIPIAVLIVSASILFLLRRKVEGILADERDYIIGGKSAILALQTYSWIAVVVMLIFYGLRDNNPVYEPVAMALALSTCGLMLLYAGLFRFLNKK